MEQLINASNLRQFCPTSPQVDANSLCCFKMLTRFRSASLVDVPQCFAFCCQRTSLAGHRNLVEARISRHVNVFLKVFSILSSTSLMLNRNQKIQFRCKSNVYKMTNKYIFDVLIQEQLLKLKANRLSAINASWSQ